jgi:predicted alpha-1,2-mannosidase
MKVIEKSNLEKPQRKYFMKIITLHCPFKKSILVVAILAWSMGCAECAPPSASRLVDYVRPMVGTKGSGDGSTYPGPSAPFGMVQLSPDTDRQACSGYKYAHTSILGFSLTHLTGTGCADLGDFLFTPVVGTPKFVPGTKENPDSGYRSRYSHEDETASAGYYKVKLQNSGVTVELTASERAGMMRFTFPESNQSAILTDLNHFLWPDWEKTRALVWSHLRVEDNRTVTGFHLTHGWSKERPLYFAARYSRPFDHFQIVSDGKPVDAYPIQNSNEAAGTNLQFLAEYKTHSNEVILVKVGISAVSAANALKNLDGEIPDWNFERVENETRDKWDHELGKIRIEGTEDKKATFYTSMYHAMLAPNLYQDVTGEYLGLDKNIHQAKGFTNYTVFSLWDTYRAEHPLLALIESRRDSDMINSLLAHYDQSADHMLPAWSLQANETWCMIGYHAVPVIVDGYLKGVKGIDAKRAFEAIKTTAMNPGYSGLAAYAKLGWVPCDKYGESVSKTLEYAYDDFCIAQMAKALGQRQDYEYFMRRAGSFKNVFDPATGLMRGKDSQGQWRTPFDPHHWTMGPGGDYTEATAWQYSWYVPQDVPGLMALMGGKAKFIEKLDSLFTFGGGDSKEVLAQGRIGEYWHGNEPGHHTIYLYCYAGEPWKAAKRLHQVVETQYGDQPDSLCGNDDCGQMSAWYIFTVMGFYPVCPAADYYVIGSPAVSKAVIHLSNGNTFTMTAENLSAENIYVQSVSLNGGDWDNPFLPYRELKNGGTLNFVMGPSPSKWGTHPSIPK